MREAEASAALVRRLLAEIRADREALRERVGEVRQFARGDDSAPPERSAALALTLDRSYTALESILERVAQRGRAVCRPVPMGTAVCSRMPVSTSPACARRSSARSPGPPRAS